MLPELFKEFISGYQKKTAGPFYKDNFTAQITDRVPSVIRQNISNSYQYTIKGSVGTGQWAETPWVAVLDSDITNSVQNGYYVCYLINPKQKTMYLGLGVGWTQFATKYKSLDAQKAIADYSNYLLEQLNHVPHGFVSGPIDLSAFHALSKGYELGQILSKKYEINNLDEETLLSDLSALLKVYAELRDIVGVSIHNISYEKVKSNTKISDLEKIENQRTLKGKPKIHAIQDLGNPLVRRIPVGNSESDSVNEEDLPYTLVEDELEIIKEKLKNISRNEPPEKVRREAYRTVRDPQIALLIKQSKNYICEICGREPFIQQNGKPYAEADHIQPLGGDYKGLDTPDNMRCLCAQCHAVITHGSDMVIESLLQPTKWAKHP